MRWYAINGLRNHKRFTTHVDVKLRIQYYLVSFLRRMALENKQPTFDQIVLHIMPLLKNGDTPAQQTILTVLEHLAERIGDHQWQLRQGAQSHLF